MRCASEPRDGCSDSRRRTRATPGLLVLALLGLPLLAGCEGQQLNWNWGAPPDPNAAPGSTATPAKPNSTIQPALSPVLERMRRAYPDLESGRFISIADFESPGQVALFRTVGPGDREDGHTQPTLSILRSRNETGAGSLKAVLDPNERLLLDGKHSEQYVLKRDWRSYGLLLMSIFGPPTGAAVEFGVQSGQPPLEIARTLQVRPGWNLLKLDVDTLGEYVNLADVRVLWWRIAQPTAGAELYIDDVLLADNTRWLAGEESVGESLRIYQRGQRIHVQSPDRFEIAFADGLVVDWRDPNSDNLVDVGGLGPWPVPLAADWSKPLSPPIVYDDPAHYSTWGAAAATQQRVIEATTFRAVIEGEWRFVSDTPPADPNVPLPGHFWRYTVYPTGAAYLQITSRAGASGWSGVRVGYAIGLDGRRDFKLVAPPEGASTALPVPFALATRAGSNRADLLWTWPRETGIEHERTYASQDDRRLALVVGDLAPADKLTTAHLLRFWPRDLDGLPEAVSIARDYQQPMNLRPTAGELRTDIPGDENHDGYNEAEGCYELALADKVVRVEVNPGGTLRHNPVFRVHNTAGRRAWVYARGRAVDTTGRDASDRLLFRLGPILTAPTAVEVHVAPPAEP